MMEFSVRDCAMLSVFTLPEVRGLVLAPGFHMPVHCILGRVQRSSNKPLGKRRVPFPHPVPFLFPDQLTSNLCPEGFWISARIPLEGGILFLRLGPLLRGEVYSRPHFQME